MFSIVFHPSIFLCPETSQDKQFIIATEAEIRDCIEGLHKVDNRNLIYTKRYVNYMYSVAYC